MLDRVVGRSLVVAIIYNESLFGFNTCYMHVHDIVLTCRCVRVRAWAEDRAWQISCIRLIVNETCQLEQAKKDAVNSSYIP